jgi:hypothetical protein
VRSSRIPIHKPTALALADATSQALIVNRQPIQKTNSGDRVGSVSWIDVLSHFDRPSDVACSNSLLAVRRARSPWVPEYFHVYFPVWRI